MKKDFPLLAEAGKLSFNEMVPSFNKLKKDLELQYEKLKKLSIHRDIFLNKVEKLYTAFSNDIETLEKEFNDSNKIFQETVMFFGYDEKDEKYKSPDKFFNNINDFLNEVEKNIIKNEPKKNFNRKFEIGMKISGNSNQMEEIINQMKTRVNK